MSHLRSQIRARAAVVVGNLTTTADRVYVGRTRPLAEGQEPSLLIYAQSETDGRDTTGRPPILMRQLRLFVEGRVTAADPPDDLLDRIAVEVEVAMASDVKLGGLVMDTLLVATEIVIEAQGKSHIGGIRLEYRVKYRTTQDDPELAA